MFKSTPLKGHATGKLHGLHAATLTVDQITNSSGPLNDSQVADYTKLTIKLFLPYFFTC